MNRELHALPKATTVEWGTLDSVLAKWQQNHPANAWNCFFVLPVWVRAWWNSFGQNAELYVRSIRRNGRTIGIAPLAKKNRSASLIGDQNVCDHLDFIVAPEHATEFYQTLIHQLWQDGITRVELGLLRPDSSAFAGLLPLAAKMGCRVSCEPAATSYELVLPNSWKEYLYRLSSKERHEIRRKLRRLHRAGSVNFRLVEDATAAKREMETFLQLFKMNRPEKAAFMTHKMGSFFRDLAIQLAASGFLRLYFLDLDEKPIAAVICFDYQSTRYLYNNGYDSRYSGLSAGLLSKVLSLKDSFSFGISTYDFLKGSETYKQRLGGRPVPLYQCLLELN